MKMIGLMSLVIGFLALKGKGGPISGGVSAKVDWWRDNSFNTPSSQYLYSSFREKVFEPLVDKIFGDIQLLKQGQVVIGDLGYGSLAAGLIAVMGVIYLLVEMKITRQINEGSPKRGREETSRVL
jgi:hypothetical protein